MDNQSPRKIVVDKISESLKGNSLSLDLSSYQITELPPNIYELFSLRWLNLRENNLSSLAPELGKLINLNELDLGNNLIRSLPYQLGNLRKLSWLSLKENQINDLPESIGNLKNLRWLNLHSNKLTKLPASIKELKSLIWLSLSNNILTEVPPEIGDISNLAELDLQNNQITTLPPELSKLSRLVMLDLRGNPLPIPPEILEKRNEPQFILKYYFSLTEKKAINETKVIIVGQGSVGKTSLVQRIVNETFNPFESKTDGISISKWEIDDNKKILEGQKQDEVPQKIKLNLWDFGGQEIMHATHQFFLTKRSLYLLILDARLTQEENRVEYWLKIVQSFGSDSPIIIIGNKIDQHPLDIDKTGLRTKYPNIVAILNASAAENIGIEAIKEEIIKQVDTLPHVRDLLPETWFTIKHQLEILRETKNYLAQNEYLNICKLYGVSDELSQRTLIGFLHDLGVVLHFQDDPRLEALGILNPSWVTNGVYKILNSHVLFQNKGVLTVSMLDEILNTPEYPRDKRLFIIDMMRKFELCFDIESEKTFLVPDLLPKDEPYTGDWSDTLGFQFHYNVLPSSIITRFIVRMQAFIHQATAWRSGAVLINEKNSALVKADYEERSISILINGEKNTRRDFLAMIRGAFQGIHKTIAKIEASAKVPHPNHPNLILDFDELLEFERKGVIEFPRKVNDQVVHCNVESLLAGIEFKSKTKIFISYAIKNKQFIARLAEKLKSENFDVWWDTVDVEGGDIWTQQIENGITQSDHVLVALSPDSVNSKWVSREIIYAESQGKDIIPVLYKSCEIPIAIINKQYVDFSKKTFDVAFTNLIDVLRGRP